MRIIVITSWPTDVIDGSGTAVFFNSLVGGLRNRGYDIDLIAPRFDISDYVEVTLHRFLFNTELRTDPRLNKAQAIIGFDYDGFGLDPAQHPPLITSAHAVYGDVIRWESEPARTMVQSQAFFDRIAMQKARCVTSGSQYAKDRIVALYGIEPEKITVIPHGIPQPPWLPLVNAEPRLPNDHPVILSVGKMYPRKRTNILLHAIALLRSKYPTLELRIMGDGLEWDRLHTLADELDLNANITWLGGISQVADEVTFAHEWRQADILAHPSSQETFGFVYLEAMMLGKPIVAARAGAAPEVLDDAALLVEPENPAALAEAIDQFLSDKTLCANYGRRAQLQALQFTHQRMIDGYMQIIEEVVVQTR